MDKLMMSISLSMKLKPQIVLLKKKYYSLVLGLPQLKVKVLPLLMMTHKRVM